jgi:hypothetical protein
MSENGNGNGNKLPAMHQMVAGGKVQAIIPHSIEECFRLAQYVVASGLAPRDVKTPEQACVTIMHGLEVGVPPMAALQGISSINGRPCIWGDLALGLVRSSGALESIKEWLDGPEGADTRIAWCEVKRKGEEPLRRKFSVADAKNAGLWGKRGQGGQPTPWVTYPERMLGMRARAWALRDAFADVLKGLHIREEVEDIREPRDITPPPPPPGVRVNGKESGPTMDAVQGSSPRAADGQGGSRPTPQASEDASLPGSLAASPDPAASDFPDLPAHLDRRNGAVEAEVVEDEPQGMTPEQLAAYLDEQGIKAPSQVDL